MIKHCKHFLWVLTLTLLSIIQAVAQPVITGFVPVTDAMLQNPDPADWLSWRRTLDSWGYSPLQQITRDNIGELEMVWSRDLVAEGMQEGTPLVYAGIMYMPNPKDVIQALDAKTGELIWEYRRSMPADLKEKVGGAAETKRNIAIYDNLIIHTSNDDFIVALDAVTGKLVWETRILDYQKQPAQQSNGPIIADGKAISGRGCFPRAGPTACVITAHDARTGKEVWRFFNIQKAGGADDTWGDVPYEGRWHVGAWMMPSYDPQLRLIYMGTSVTAPAPKFLLSGNQNQYLYHNSTLALNPDTGELAWYYQHLVDHWDLDHPFERYLIDTAVTPDAAAVAWINPRIKPGERRKVVTGIPGKNGVVYTLDRETGEFLWARPTVKQTVVGDIDGETGKATVNPEMLYTAMGQERLVCPSTSGGKMWTAGAYSPLTNVMYQPVQNTCMVATVTIDKPDPEALYGFFGKVQITPGTDKLGTVHAISVETGKTVWQYEQRAATTSIVATGGGLVFGGDAIGVFRAFDQNDGKILWQTELGSPVTGYPISFAVNGRQYIAVSTGFSITTLSHLRLTPELKPGNVNKLYVFALPVENSQK
ncbi:MAG: methanol dehydrogenase large subunit protein [Gammaproteobacteria bacterium]|nr:methanol dehydrogenase large subunit protein [Gammaproteobacteria bacterium]